ncbi:MAG: carbamate kinase [Nitrososphaeria archaeon]|nr:carbamate kinase [Nitrososphaeria archaeon]NIQ32478.1 carbamate kinase [Nitrososphaeria archaeon]
MGKLLLVALGGNAIKKADEEGTFREQLKNVKTTCWFLLELIKKGYRLVITHGNGPQIGALMLQNEEAERLVPLQPLYVLGAMTQGQIGYMLQQTLINHLRQAGLEWPVTTVMTQVSVDRDDSDFRNPSKPVGPFYTREEAQQLEEEKGYVIKKVMLEGNRQYRRVVPSPDPLGLIEAEAIRRLVEAGVIVIAAGGGGVPVTRDKDGELKGVEAVIDKDLAGEKLARIIGVEVFLILTDIDRVRLNFGRPDEKPIDKMTIDEARRYLAEGHFPPGSMGPKILACIRFIEQGGKKAIITSLDKAVEALEGRAGTLIHQD